MAIEPFYYTFHGLDYDAIRSVLKRTYPEIAHPTIRETMIEDGTKLVKWLAQPGRKR